jgi:iron complex outermembrane receptor protein
MTMHACIAKPARSGINSFVRSLRLSTALILFGWGGVAAAQEAPVAADGSDGTEIVVTAQKRSERLQDVPIAISAIGNQQLVDAHVVGNRDLARLVPSLAVKPLVPGESQIILRGINTGYGLSPAVSYYLDETPFALRSDGFSGAPDIDFFDVARVEVLRGPQGTLYGASSMGGTIRVITNTPDPDTFAVKAEVSGSGVKGGSGLNYSGKLVLNVPLATDLAARLFASHDHFTGFSDRVLPVNGYFAISPSDPVAQRNDNKADLLSTRLTLAWTPADWTITPSVSYQRTVANGYAYSDSNRPEYSYSDTFRSRNVNRFVVANLKVEKPLGFADLTSSTSYLDKQASNLQDYAGQGERIYRGNGGTPTGLVPMTSYLPKSYKSFVQELRLTGESGILNWTVGGYYEHTRILEEQYITSPVLDAFLSPSTPPGYNFFDIIPSTDEQFAAFADGTLKISRTLAFSAGARLFHYKQNYAYSEGGLTADGIYIPGISSAKTGVNPRFNLNFTPTRDLSLYATVSKGFRVGGANPALANNGGAACTYADVFRQGFGPDSVWNYEVGAKATGFERRLTVNAAAYRLDWGNIQQQVNSTCGSFVGNFGDARIHGVELEASLKVLDGFTLSASGSYTDAKFKSFNPGYANSVNISQGQRLVNTPRWQGNLGGEYKIDLGDERGLKARLDVQYVGSTPTSYTYVTDIYTRPSYTNLNLALGGHIGQAELELFVRNLTDSFQVLDASPGRARNYARYMVAPPRTIGLTLRYGM